VSEFDHNDKMEMRCNFRIGKPFPVTFTN